MEIGKEYQFKKVVGAHDLASYMGSGGEDVFATPMMICWMEAASVKCLALEDKELCSLGIKVDVEHIAATPLGSEVTVTSKLIKAEGKKYTFQVEAYDQFEKIGFGTHVRVVTKVGSFMEKTNKKKPADS